SGRSQVKSFSAEMISAAEVAVGIEQLLCQGLEHNRFELHYQPQFSLTGKVVGLEALLRMRNDEGEYLAPASLVRIAEDTGLIVPVGSWVLREACRQLR